MEPSGPLFKIKLASGRILGPLDLERVRLLVLKNQIVGTETAREYPNGEWVDINTIAAISEMVLAHAEGRLAKDSSPVSASGYSPILGDPAQIKTHVLPGANPVLTGSQTLGKLKE